MASCDTITQEGDSELNGATVRLVWTDPEEERTHTIQRWEIEAWRIPLAMFGRAIRNRALRRPQHELATTVGVPNQGDPYEPATVAVLSAAAFRPLPAPRQIP
jgi:hypothetical protein